MHPLLFKLGRVSIHAYGCLIAAGFLAGVLVIKRLARQSGLNVDRVVSLTIWSSLIGFAGARLLFIITRFADFYADPAVVFRVWEGGLVFVGGPAAVIPFLIWYLRRHHLPGWKVADAMVPGLVMAHMFGRIGCFMAGCCYGKPTQSWIGIRLHSPLVAPHLHGVPLHPTQLYSVATLFILFWCLIRVFRHKRFDGQVIITYFMAYPAARCILELFRGDQVRGFVIRDVLSTSQFVSGLIFLISAVVLVVRLRQVRQVLDPISHKRKNLIHP